MQQLTLLTDTPLSRRSDPETRHVAAEKLKASGVLAKQQYAVLGAVRRWSGWTAVEIVQRAGIDRHAASQNWPAGSRLT